MAAPKHFKISDLSGEPDELGDFCLAEIDWSPPKPWDEDGAAPTKMAGSPNALYAIVRDHWRQKNKGTIVYIGMTTNLPARFANHWRADDIRSKRGATSLSIGRVTYSGRHCRWAQKNPGAALNQIEHILIWALWPTLVNDRKQNSLPLLTGKNVPDARPWIIRRAGYRFHGRMPREVVYPWLIVKPGRDRSLNS